MWKILCFVALCVTPVFSQGLNLAEQVCDANRRRVGVQTTNANVLLGGLFDIRSAGVGGIGCGLPSLESMQVYEAARWTIAQLNTNNYVNGIRFGIEAFDSCTQLSSTMAAVHNFYPQSVGLAGTSRNGASYCTKSSSVYKLGLLGTMHSGLSMSVAEMAPRIPASLISMQSSSPALSNKNMYPTFLRTDQSATVFSSAVAQLLKKLMWEKIVIVYATDEYGKGGYQEILKAAYKAGICVGGAIGVPHAGSTGEYETLLRRLSSFGVTAAAFYGKPEDALTTMQAVQNLINQGVQGLREVKWLFGELELERDYSSYTAAHGAIVAPAGVIAINGFKNYFTTLDVNNPPAENPWLQDWFMNKYQCKLPGVNYAPFVTKPACSVSSTQRSADFHQTPYVDQTILAILAYAEAIKTACSGSSGVCNSLRNMDPLTFHRSYLSKVNVTFPSNFMIRELSDFHFAFDVHGDPLYAAYTFYNYNNNGGNFNFQNFGRYLNGKLIMNATPSFPRPGSANLAVPSQCASSGCTNCLQPVIDVTLAYQPGDVVVAALVSAHEPGSQSLSCGEVIPDRLIDAVAARYAASNAGDLSTRGVSVGYLIVDVCPGVEVAQSFLTNLLGGYKLYTDSRGRTITTTNIVAIFDMTSEDTGSYIAPLLTAQGLPQIRVASTSSMFLHNPLYPRVVSLVPTQDTVHLAIAQMLSRKGWNYVQIISEAKGSYYKAAESFRRVASRFGICVALWSTFGMDPTTTLNGMRGVQNAPVVVVFGTRTHVRSLMAAIKTVTASPTVQRQLTFVSGSEEFGTSDTLVKDYVAEMEGFMSVQLVERTDALMSNWLNSLSLTAIASDVFLSAWYEQKFDCSLSSASRGRYKLLCSTAQSISISNAYFGYAPYIVKGINSVAAAISSILNDKCGTGSRGLCGQFRSLNNLGDLVAGILRNSNANTEFEIANGEGTSDLSFFNYRGGAYADVGRFDSNNRRISTLATNNMVTIPAVSGTTKCFGRCTQCQYLFSYQDFGYVAGDFMIGATFLINDQGPAYQRPFVCGNDPTASGFHFTSALTYALDQINRGIGPVKLNNVTLGSLFMDHCANSRRAYGQVADVYSGLTQLTLRDAMGNKPRFSANNILAWMADNTGSTKEVLEMLQPLGIPVVSPAATAASLMESPNFFRTLQGDGTLAMAVVKLCKTLGFTYLQVVHSADSYGREGLSRMINTARQEGLCVVNSFELDTAANASRAVNGVSAGTSKVVILYMGSSLTTAFLSEAAKMTSDQLTIIAPEPHSDILAATTNKFNLQNLLSFQMQNPTLADFNNFINNVAMHDKNPFFAPYYMKVFQCNLPGYYMHPTDCRNQPITSATQYSAMSYDLLTINAVYAIAGALQTTLVEFCGSDYVGACMAFMQSDDMHRRFVENLKLVQFQDPSNRFFRFLEREGNIVYDVLRFNGNQYETVGTYGGASLLLNDKTQLATYYKNVQSLCSSACSECVFSGISFSHTSGDIYLGGVFDVHAKGQGVFDCGTINTEHGFQLLEAFHFALQKVNAKQGQFANILQGVNLGGVGLDACQSAIRGGYVVSNINNGLTTLVRDGREIKPENIDVYIGSYSSGSSMYLARILKDLQVPQISYAATSNALSDQFVYPYFFRTVPADDKQVLGMLKYLDINNLRYVQLLYTKNSFGEQGIAQFDYLIRRDNFSVCVAQRVGFPGIDVVSDESSDDVVIELLQKPVANTVVIFASTNHIRSFLRAVSRNSEAAGTFKFLGPTTWGDRYTVTENIPNVGNDAVTFVLDFQGGVGGFLSSYLTKRNPANARNNPWFEEWFQHTLNCYTSAGSSQVYPVPCGPNSDLQTKVIEDNGVLHVMNAVYAAAYAVDATLKEKCGENYAAVCDAYRSSSNRRTSIRDNLEKVNFTDDTNAEFHFENREGNKGYKLFKLTTSPLDTDSVVYNRDFVGTFSNENDLTLFMDLVPKYDGSCERKDACAECPTVRNRGLRYAVGGDPNAAVTLIGVFDVHNKGSELYQCGSINLEGFQKFLTFFWTLNGIATSNNMRLLALDTCSNSLRVGQDLYGLVKDGQLCNSERFDLNNMDKDNIGAVVVSGEENAVAASRVLEPLMVPYVSSDSLSPLMDDHQYLLRSVTPWSGFVRILLKFLEDSRWTYVNSIYVKSGRQGLDHTVFQKLVQESSVCLREGLALAEDATDPEIRTALAKLNAESGSRVVVLFTQPQLSFNILRLAKELGIADDFLWIFAVDLPNVMNNVPSGLTFQAIVLQQVIAPRDDFKQYIRNLAYDVNVADRNRASIPRTWWEDFYQTVHKCRLHDAVFPLHFDTNCSLASAVNNISQDTNVHHTFLASSFSMRGLGQFISRCRAGEDLTNCLRRLSLSREVIRNDILNEQLNTDATTYRFNKPYRYIEATYQIDRINVVDGQIDRVRYRTYSDGSFTTYSNVQLIESECQRPDGCGCKQTTPFTQAQTGAAFSPQSPRNYYKYDANGKRQYEWPIWAIVMAVLTALGLFITIIIFCYLLIFYPVKGGTSVLGYLTMIGIMGIYAVNFAFFIHATDATCGARRFVMGVVYTVVFASLLVKAVDNWRFADYEYSNHQYRGLTNSCTLFLIALGIILVQCIIPIEWLILVHPTASKWTSGTMHDYWWCDPHDEYDVGLVCSFIFVMFVILLTAIFAALAWDSESNNLESRWILVSAISTAGCFLVWMIVTTNAGAVYRDPAVAIANFVNATLLLIFIPLRKLHLLCEAKNNKEDIYANGDFDPYSHVYSNQSYDPQDYQYGPSDKADDAFSDH